MMTEQITGLIEDAWGGCMADFRPCAFFDERLDCVRIIARDCSVLEERINDRLTVLIDNYEPDSKRKYIGFTFKGAKHFCVEQGWGAATSIRITEFLDAVVVAFPDAAVEMFINVFARPLVESAGINDVEVPEGALAAA